MCRTRLIKKKMAGVDWLNAFFERFDDLSIREPTPTSLPRALEFNRASVDKFF